jgi:uncharacterized protein YbcI
MADCLDCAADIGREIALVHEKAYQEAIAAPEVSVADNFVTVVMDFDLWRAERTLIGAGHAPLVRQTREAYQDAIRTTFTAIVERATGRRVVGFANRTVVEEPGAWILDVFRLEPVAAPVLD